MNSSIYYADECLIRRRSEIDDFQEIRVAVVGNVDSGKSTLLGVLTHCELDNGRGLARQRLFRHKHELETGRTSSIGNDILGFDSSGNVVNKPSSHGNSQQWSKICEESSKVITFIDLAGHEKYLKTTIFGMTGHSPDYTLLMIGANAGIVGMTKEHLGVTLALNIPVFVVITKIDMCPPNILQNTISCLKKVLKSPGCRKIPIIVESDEDVVISATNFVSERLCPIFQVSNVEGTNLHYLKKFLNLLNSRAPNHDNCPAEFQIDEVYSVPGVGTVVSGISLKGIIHTNETLLLGPDTLGNFLPVSIKSIHRKRLPVKEVRSGQTASFALKKIRKNEIRKGMVMLHCSLNPKSYWEFEGEILVLHHPTTISARYQAMVHCGSIRQTAQILSMSQDCLRTGDKAKVHFRFIKNPEYLNIGMKLIFREGRTKAIGTVTKFFGIHHYWRNELIKKLDPIPGTRLLDVAGGTGDVAFEFLRYTNERNDHESSVIVCDFNENMLKIGEKRAQKFGFHSDRCQWIIGDAMNLPFDSESFDAYTISFGIRNVVNVNRAVQEAFRVLKPGGIFLCLEFSSQVNNPIVKSVYDWYSFEIIPVMGEILLNDWQSYQYLVESIRKFPDQETFKSMIETNGFTLVDYENFLSGVTSIHYGFKPL
ncbi:ubiE/COQ5 methyltransferase GTP-binding protein-like protein [Euroglyphus maynei]|uniref:2-methoxy-6-polyprenyl-1,4-benzoquinol methylase, mitochondrial n=1 Tax=Euroglyphus maynei TaxID=6958 RepID=A0A1Y3BL88_EURMA|nr:ubiE/COQ5 methyltransferase GTP-binding protein-like protein [Euroglyphus maynei]